MATIKFQCRDGSFDIRDTETQGRQDVPCRRQGGVAIDHCIAGNNYNQSLCDNQMSASSSGALKGSNDSFLDKHKNHLLIAVALVAGYFAYKKFKN